MESVLLSNLEFCQADDFSIVGADTTELLKLLEETKEENLLSSGDEILAQKKNSAAPLEHNYAFNATEDPLWSQAHSVSTMQNYDQGNQIDLPESDISLQNTDDEKWVDQFLNLKKNDNPVSVSNSPLNTDSAREPSSSLCLQKPTESSVEAVSSVTNPPDTTMPSSSQKSRKRKASGYSTESDAGESVLDRNTKNAIAARENRLKKKLYIEGLEKKNQELEKENGGMLVKMEEQEDRISQLEREVKYLKNVLHNESALSSLLGNLEPDTSVRLSIAGQGGKRRRGGGSREVIPMSKGVCLHVDGQTASLELCSLCAVKAKGGSF